VCHRGHTWSEATQTLKKLYKLLETLRNSTYCHLRYYFYEQTVCLSHWGWSHDWSTHSFGCAWLHEGQSNSQYNRKDYQEYIKGWLTLATPPNCEENSEEDTQTSQQHLKVNVHFYNLQRFIFHSDLFYNLQPCFILFLNFILNLKFFPTHVEGSISL